MTGVSQVLAVMFFLLVIIKEGLTLHCVECNSYAQPECDNDPKAYTKLCPQNATSCRKMEQEIYYDDDYHVRTIRQCANISGPMECIERTGTYRFKVFYCHCKDDNCNVAPTLSLSLGLVFALSAAAALFAKL